MTLDFRGAMLSHFIHTVRGEKGLKVDAPVSPLFEQLAGKDMVELVELLLDSGHRWHYRRLFRDPAQQAFYVALRSDLLEHFHEDGLAAEFCRRRFADA